MMLSDLKQTSPPFTLPDGWTYHTGVRNGVTIYCLYNTIDDLFMEVNVAHTPQTWATTVKTLVKPKTGKG